MISSGLNKNVNKVRIKEGNNTFYSTDVLHLLSGY